MRTILITAFLFMIGSVPAVSAQDEQYAHEYTPLREQKIKYRDWTYENVRTGESVNLREFARDKKLVLVFYFAPWCHNSKYEMPFLQSLHDRYADRGLGIVGVNLYASLERVRRELDEKKITFPVVSESVSKFDRQKSLHYRYRKKTGDDRKWGTPWNLFLPVSAISRKGDVLLKKAVIANGELIEREAEDYIRRQLDLPAIGENASKEKTKNAGKDVEVCEEDAETPFKKPE